MPSKNTKQKKKYAAKKRAAKAKKKPAGIKKASAKRAATGGRAKARGKAKATCTALPAEVPKLAAKYANLSNASVPWTWNQVKPNLTAASRSKIRNYARDKGLVATAPLDPKQNYVKLPKGAPPFVKFPAKYVADTQKLPKSMFLDTDSVQFTYLNNNLAARNSNYNPKTQTFKGSPKKYTWHHDQDPPGQMQLVEFGIHNSTNHSGGRNVWGGGTDYR